MKIFLVASRLLDEIPQILLFFYLEERKFGTIPSTRIWIYIKLESFYITSSLFHIPFFPSIILRAIWKNNYYPPFFDWGKIYCSLVRPWIETEIVESPVEFSLSLSPPVLRIPYTSCIDLCLRPSVKLRSPIAKSITWHLPASWTDRCFSSICHAFPTFALLLDSAEKKTKKERKGEKDRREMFWRARINGTLFFRVF